MKWLIVVLVILEILLTGSPIPEPASQPLTPPVAPPHSIQSTLPSETEEAPHVPEETEINSSHSD